MQELAHKKAAELAAEARARKQALPPGDDRPLEDLLSFIGTEPARCAWRCSSCHFDLGYIPVPPVLPARRFKLVALLCAFLNCIVLALHRIVKTASHYSYTVQT